jgi:peptidoglycan-associated lipoprotein
MHKTRLLAGILVAVLLAACAGRKTTSTTSATTQVATPPPVAATTAPLSDSGSGPAAPAAVGMPATRVIYFDFDSSDIRPEFNEAVAAHARYLARNASIRVRLEGNTDERGSREYNVGLGERRAQTVRRALLLQGVAEAQVTTVSYGEEKPAVAGSNEDAWAKNRRVEFAYQN